MNNLEALKKETADHETKATESFERCDTDGCVSQWAHGINAQLKRQQAKIVENGGKADFPALFDLDGNRVKARLGNGRFGPVWILLDEKCELIKFVSAFPKRESTMRKKGFVEGEEEAEAWACLEGSGTGLAGASSVYVKVFRKDDGFPKGSKVVK